MEEVKQGLSPDTKSVSTFIFDFPANFHSEDYYLCVKKLDCFYTRYVLSLLFLYN